MFSCKILADSINVSGCRLTTMEVSFPRIVLSDFNTHRALSRNSSSSRAIPIEKIIKKVMDSPFIPEYWGKNQSGMSAMSTIEQTDEAIALWVETRDLMIGQVRKFMDLGVHKQLTNRLLEPWLYQTGIVSATTFENFFALRDDSDAQPEIQKIAQMMKKEMKNSTPKLLQEGEWHFPLMDDLSELSQKYSIDDIKKICVGRLCRISYLTHNGVRNPDEDIKLCKRLAKNGHWSPFEHCAMAMDNSVQMGNFVGWKQYRKFFDGEDVFVKFNGKNDVE